MSSRHLDLEEQEQLDQLKHFWNQYGDFITWVLIAVFAAIAGWNGWQYWQRTQAAQASALYDEVERAAAAGDTARVERAFSDIRDKFGRTVFAQQAGLAAAKVMMDKGKPDAARADLAWVAEKSSDEGYQAVAKLRLAGVLADAKQYDEALKQLSGMPKSFEALAADRRGDIYSLQGKPAEARSEYLKAWQGMDERADYRNLVEVKLNALGVDPRAQKNNEAAQAKS
ncbi:MAG TPA: tetratricopeptide repeat protein [Ramlibacter sp.]|uniref:YfgM family protein n=1 Tax=Ramlibacter sp. TaxID=1917967 RepID=UPI002CA444A1|nr:tetratricopeptide repeat protein [Ramlibacter sp.]HVZ43049.1 tetratricopeptide repeat protein [Ramlibacter sp.]